MGFHPHLSHDTFIGGMSARFLGVDSLWDILCNHLPEGSELGGCNWTISMHTLYTCTETWPSLYWGRRGLSVELSPSIGGTCACCLSSVFSWHTLVLMRLCSHALCRDHFWSYKVCIIRNGEFYKETRLKVHRWSIHPRSLQNPFCSSASKWLSSRNSPNLAFRIEQIFIITDCREIPWWPLALVILFYIIHVQGRIATSFVSGL